MILTGLWCVKALPAYGWPELKHLRGSRILSPDWENTACSVDDLAKVLIERRVSVEGVFVRSFS